MRAGERAGNGGGTAWPWLAPAVLLLGVCYFVPLLRVLGISLSEPDPGLGNYLRLASDGALQHIIATTLRISIETTALSVAIGYLIAFAMVTGTPRRRAVMLVCVLVPFWISVLVRAFAWVALLRTEGLVNNTLIALHLIAEPLDLLYNEKGVVIGMVHCLVPVAVLTLYGQMQGIDQRLMVAARGLGAGPFTAFRRVFLPLSLPGIAAAGVLVFISAMGFFIVPALLGGGKTLMAAEYISLLLNTTVNWGQGTTLASVLVLLVLGLVLVLSRVVDLRRALGGA